MNQQINLLLPELRPKRDWLAFPVVGILALAGLVLIAGLAAWGHYQVRALTEAKSQSDAELKSLQQQVQSLSQALAGRQASPALQAEIDRMNGLLKELDTVLSVVESGKTTADGGYVSLMRGFARQATAGVWLIGFSFSGQDAEIRGRLGDPALLPQYIRRLNAEPAFQGRRFAALDMKDGSAANPADAVTGPRYTEFILRGNLVSGEAKKP